MADRAVMDVLDWRDQIFMPMHTFLLTSLLLGMFFRRKLRLEHAPVYLLVLYLLMTAINPMVQPRYEYAAYVLLCLEASRYFRLHEVDSPEIAGRPYSPSLVDASSAR